MSKEDELIRLTLQQRFKSPVGIRENEETLYANVAHEPLMLDNVRQIEVLQIHDAIENKISYKRFSDNKIIPSAHNITISPSTNGYITTNVDKSVSDEKITISIFPENGYKLETLVVKSGIKIIPTKKEGDVFVFIMPENDVVIYSTFELIEYSITIQPSQNGFVVSNVSVSIAGNIIIINVFPDDGYLLHTLTVFTNEETIETTKNDDEYLFTMPNGNVSINSTFEIEPPKPFEGQGVTGTYQVWGDSQTTGIEFGDFAFGYLTE